MIALWFLAASGLCLIGTRLAGLAFVGAAVTSAVQGGAFGAVATWTAATGAGLLVLGMAPRRLAVPTVGSLAALLAAFAPNAAAVLLAWGVASAAAVVVHQRSDAARNWSLAVVVADLPVAAAVAWTVAAHGFVPWPLQLDEPGGYLLLAGAVLRIPLAAGPHDRSPESGLLLVRVQMLVLVALVASAGSGPSRTLMAVSAVAFAVASLAKRSGVGDAVQEGALWGILLGAGAMEWVPGGWAWAALAAGTLVHLARVSQEQRGAERPGWDAALGGALGSPFFAAAAPAALGATGAGGPLGAIALVGLAAGLAGRVVAPAARLRGRVPMAPRAVVLLLALALALWAPLAIPPSSFTLDSEFWPPAWSAGLLAPAAVLGAWGSRLLAPGRMRRPRTPVFGPVAFVASGVRSLAEKTAPPKSPLILLALVSAAAAGIWLWGLTRGFL